MKKILCYLAIVVLLVFIVLPPVLRLTMKEENEEPVVPKDVIEMLQCTKNEDSLSISYLNGKTYNIRYTEKIVEVAPDIEDENKDELDDNVLDNARINPINTTNDDDRSFKEVLEGYAHVKKTSKEGKMIYSLDLSSSEVYDRFANKFKKEINEQMAYFKSLGYTCNTTKY